MKIAIGDKVRFLNETGSGVVSRFINKTTAAVVIEDGFEIPFLIAELVPAELPESLPTNRVEMNVPVEKPVAHPVIRKPEQREGVYVAVAPEKPTQLAISDFSLHLVNNSTYHVSYQLLAVRSSGMELLERGEVVPFSDVIMETISRKKVDEYSNLRIELLFFQQNKFAPQPPVSELIKLKPARFYKENAFQKNELLSLPALIFPVTYTGAKLYFDDPEAAGIDLQDLYQQKQLDRKEKKHSKPHQKNDPGLEMEIDLHIEELMENYSGMSNAEIVQVQLRHFQQALDKAINGHYRSLVVIHGIGNGRLKQEVRQLLSNQHLTYYDASYARYGFGATEVKLS